MLVVTAVLKGRRVNYLNPNAGLMVTKILNTNIEHPASSEQPFDTITGTKQY